VEFDEPGCRHGAGGETGARASRGFPAAVRGLPPGPVSWRMPGVVPLLGGGVEACRAEGGGVAAGAPAARGGEASG